MASRRKASTPCMIRPDRTLVEMDDEDEDLHDMETSPEKPVQGAVVAADNVSKQPPSEPPDAPDQSQATPRLQQQQPQQPQQGGYECKYCPFSTQSLNAFKEHVDASHPNVILNPLYLCAVCNFNTKKFDSLTEHNEKCHPGEINFKFKRVKLNNQTVLEQTIEGCGTTNNNNNSSSSNNNNSSTAAHNVSYPAAVAAAAAAAAAFSRGQEQGGLGKVNTGVKFAKPKIVSPSDIKRTEFHLGHLTSELRKPINAVSVNGTVLIPDASLLKPDSQSHIMPSLQRPPNFSQVPKIAVPLNTTKYNPSLDGNLTLMSSFNKFPYPTQAELSWLTAASKHPEEQIKVWFTTQRLKQGISWSPEEVEEARKKMFNGTITSAPTQTFTVLASSRPSTAHPTISTTSSSSSSVKGSSHLGASLHSLPCHLLGTTSLVLTPVANGSPVTCAPLALTLTNQVVQSLKRPLSSPVIATGIKRPSIIQTIQAPLAPAKVASTKLLSFTVDPNKTAKQLSLLRHSYTQCPFPEEDEIYRLIETTGLSRGEIKKWFSDQRLLNIKGAPPPPVLVKAEPPALPKEVVVARAVPSHFPLLERVKGKSSEQLTALEESFQRSSQPTDEELDQLSRDTKLSQTEVDCWFSERRALRDNMEKALLNLGAVPRVGPLAEKEKEKEKKKKKEEAGGGDGDSVGPQVNGASGVPEPLPPILCSSSSSSSSPPVLVASSPQPPPVLSAPSASPPVLAASSASPSSSSSPRPPVLSASTSPGPITGRCLTLLREVFSRTQWPSPEEYSQLEVQTGLGRTDIVRWFKDHRALLKSGQSLEWMEGPQQQQQQQQQQRATELLQRAAPEHNGRSSAEPPPPPPTNAVHQEARIIKALGASEGTAEVQAGSGGNKLSGPDLVQWFTDRLGHSVSDLSRSRGDQAETSINSSDKERWVKVMVAVGEESDNAVERPKLAADTEILPLEQPARVTG